MTIYNEPKARRRVLMTIDAVGGVWRYAMDLAKAMSETHGIETVFMGFGPQPSPEKASAALNIGKLVWLDAPLDWTAPDEAALATVPDSIAALALQEKVDLIHLNLPSQAAGLKVAFPIVAVSHSCVATWFAGVRGHDLPSDWHWHYLLNRKGFDRADAVIAPSRSHAAMLGKAYGRIGRLHIVHNGSGFESRETNKESFVFAAGRWWDDGKNGAVLDRAATKVDWPFVVAGSNAGPTGQYLAFDNLSHLGELSHRDTMDLMTRAAIVVSPSVYEPFGLAPLEAARAGAALVLADIPTYRELWNGVALFADPHQPAAFAEAINRLSKDSDLRLIFAKKARQRSAAFTVEAQAAAVNRIYIHLIQQSLSTTAAE